MVVFLDVLVDSRRLFFFFNAPPTTEIYTLSLHDALPISAWPGPASRTPTSGSTGPSAPQASSRSEEHTSELQSHSDLVCRLLLEKKKDVVTRPHPAPHDGHNAALVCHVVEEPPRPTGERA